MPTTLLDRVRTARRELAIALCHAEDPAFDPRTLDMAMLQRLQAAVSEGVRATAEASAEERARLRGDPIYLAYLEELARLNAALDSWHDRLLDCRTHLDRDSERLHAAGRWAEAYNRTR